MNLIKNSTIYLTSSLVNKTVPFLLLPVITRYLSPADFGILSLFILANSCIGAFVGMNINSFITKNYYEYTAKDFAIFISNSLIVIGLSTLFITLIFYFCSLYIKTLFSIQINLFLVMPILSFMMMVNTIHLTILRNEQKAIAYAFIEMMNTLITVSVTIILLVIFDKGWISQIFGIVISSSILFIIGIHQFIKRNYLNLNFSMNASYQILLQALPMIAYVLSGIIISISGRFFIEGIIGLAAVGIFSIAYNFGSFVQIITEAFNKSWSPWFYEKMRTPSSQTNLIIIRYTYLFVLFVLALALLVTLFSQFLIPLIIDFKYHEASKYVFWIAISFAIQAIYKMLFPYYILYKKHHILSLFLVIITLINLILNTLLVPTYGVIGAAYTSSISWLLGTLLAFFYKMKFCETSWRLNA